MKTVVFSNEYKYMKDAIGLASSISNEIIGISYFETKEKPEGLDKLYLAEKRLNNDSWVSIDYKICEVEKPNYIVTTYYKDNADIIAQVCGKLQIPMFTNVINLREDSNKFVVTRPILGGRALFNIKVDKTLCLAFAVQHNRFNFEGLSKVPKIIEIKEEVETRIQLKQRKKKPKSKIKIEDAEMVVGVGRGFKNKDDLKLAFELAELLNAQVGCSRPVSADYGWLPNDAWLGVSSKSIRPKLYIAIGISGAPQHIVGIQESGLIVAINKDKNAPIFKYADYGVVADLYQFLPVLIKELKNMINSSRMYRGN